LGITVVLWYVWHHCGYQWKFMLAVSVDSRHLHT